MPFLTKKSVPFKLLTFLALACAFLAYTGFVYKADVPQFAPLENKEAVNAGKQLWQQHNCGSCHQLYGLGGYLGPDVTNVISAKGKGPEYTRAIMQNGTGVMPDFNLTSEEIEQLLAFLAHTDKSGRGSVHDYSPELNGTITPKIKQ